MPIEDFIEVWDVDSLKEGDIIRANSFEQKEKDSRPVQVTSMRALIKKLNDMYTSGNPPTNEEFNKIFEKYHKINIDSVNDFVDSLEEKEDFFKVSEKKIDKKGNVIIKLNKLDKARRIDIIKSIAKKMLKKLSEEQLLNLLEEGIRKNNQTEELEEIDKDLDKDDIKVDGHRGCFKFTINGKDIMVLS